MEKVIYECDGDEFETMNLAEAIAWLQAVACEQPCPADQVTFDIQQGGDPWDGYSIARVRIVREETAEEADERLRIWDAEDKHLEAEQEARERAALHALKAKYEANHA